MEKEAEDYLQRLEALHVTHFGSEANFVAGNKLTHAGLHLVDNLKLIVDLDYQLLVTIDFMTFHLGYDEIIRRVAPNLLRCVENTKRNPNLASYLEENKRNVFTAAGFAF